MKVILFLACMLFLSGLVHAGAEVAPFNANTDPLTAYDNAHLLMLGSFVMFMAPFYIEWMLRTDSEVYFSHHTIGLRNVPSRMKNERNIFVKGIGILLPYFIGACYFFLVHVDGFTNSTLVDPNVHILWIWVVFYILYLHGRAWWPTIMYPAYEDKRGGWRFLVGSIVHVASLLMHVGALITVIIGSVIYGSWANIWTSTVNGVFLCLYWALAVLVILGELTIFIVNLVSQYSTV